MNEKQKVGVLSLRALPVVIPKLKGQFGGSETSAWLTAKALASLENLDVSLLTRHHTRQPRQQVDGVEILSDWQLIEIARESLAGVAELQPEFPWLKIRKFSPSLFWKIPVLAAVRQFFPNRSYELRENPFIQQFDFDAILLFGANLVSAKAILSLKHKKTKTILLIRANAELNERFAKEDDFQNEYGERSEVVRYAISNASQIVVQTEHQQRLLLDHFHRKATVIPNPFDLKSWDQQLSNVEQPKPVETENYVLWVGRPDRFHKRPLALLEVAARCPDIPFVMVLNRGVQEVREEIELIKTQNVTILDQVPFAQMPQLYKNAIAFAFTGSIEHEGFPNVLLQSAATSTPIVSLDFLPDLILRSGGAILSGTTEKMAEDIRSLLLNKEKAEQLGRAGREMIEQHIDMHQYAVLLEELTKDNE